MSWRGPEDEEQQENDPFEFELWAGTNEIDLRDEEDEMCDHEEHKEVVSLQEMRGANAMGLGGQFGTSEAMIVCKKCGKAKPAERVDQQRGPF